MTCVCSQARELCPENFVLDIVEGKMMGKAIWGRKRMELLHDVMDGRDYGQLKDLMSDIKMETG